MRNLIWGSVEVNESPKISHEPTITLELAKKPNITHVLTQAQKPIPRSGAPEGPHTYESTKKPTHEDEKIALVLALVGGFATWNIFRWNTESETVVLIFVLNWSRKVVMHAEMQNSYDKFIKHGKWNRSAHFRAEPKSGFQSLIINEIEIVMRDEKTNTKNETAVLIFVLNWNQDSNF